MQSALSGALALFNFTHVHHSYFIGIVAIKCFVSFGIEYNSWHTEFIRTALNTYGCVALGSPLAISGCPSDQQINVQS